MGTVTGGWTQAEDVVQETFIRAYWALTASETNRPGGTRPVDASKAGQWLFQIARSEIGRIYRKKSEADKQALLQEKARCEPSPSVEDQAVFNYLLQQIMDALSTKQRQSFRLRMIDGWTVKQIAEFLNISPNTIKKRLVAAYGIARTFFLDDLGTDREEEHPPL